MAPGKKPPLRHYLQFRDLSRAEYEHLFARTRWIKDRFKRYQRYWPLEDRTLAMIFEKQSTRTRLSFEAGMHQLGGTAIFLNTRDSQLGRGEPVEDAAQVISRMCDLVMIRTFEQEIIERFAASSRVPVINGLTNQYHPCQILADIYTFIEHRGAIRGKTRGLDRRLEQHVHDLAAGGGDLRLQAATCRRRRATRSKPSRNRQNCRVLRRSDAGRPGRGPRHHRRLDLDGLRVGERGAQEGLRRLAGGRAT